MLVMAFCPSLILISLKRYLIVHHVFGRYRPEALSAELYEFRNQTNSDSIHQSDAQAGSSRTRFATSAVRDQAWVSKIKSAIGDHNSFGNSSVTEQGAVSIC
jgi:hypothetical protein